jgi:hypothetical protein
MLGGTVLPNQSSPGLWPDWQKTRQEIAAKGKEALDKIKSSNQVIKSSHQIKSSNQVIKSSHQIKSSNQELRLTHHQ